jgi:hypothetical protein
VSWQNIAASGAESSTLFHAKDIVDALILATPKGVLPYFAPERNAPGASFTLTFLTFPTPAPLFFLQREAARQRLLLRLSHRSPRRSHCGSLRLRSRPQKDYKKHQGHCGGAQL